MGISHPPPTSVAAWASTPCCATIARAVISRPLVTTCYDTSLSIQTRPLLPLRFRSTRVHATQASVCWRAQSTVDSLFFIDVPTNPGPRSFHAWPVRRCRGRRSAHALRLLFFRPPKVHEPVPNISRSGPRNPSLTELWGRWGPRDRDTRAD